VPRRETYVPKHRGPATEPALKRGIRKSFVLSGVAVASTGLAVSSGVLAPDDAIGENVGAAISAAQDRPDTPASLIAEERERQPSRSDRRTAADQKDARELMQQSGGQDTAVEDLSSADPRSVARSLMAEYGFSESEFGCLDALWVSESDWDPTADNPTSTAYGIPQALTGGTHDNLPADYMTNPVSQIEWGLWYIKNSYGSACAAWEFKQANNWY
jgi:hypothetical protein